MAARRPGLILLVTSTITIVKAGHVGVVDLFGRVSTNTLKSGLQIVNPLARVDSDVGPDARDQGDDGGAVEGRHDDA